MHSLLNAIILPLILLISSIGHQIAVINTKSDVLSNTGYVGDKRVVVLDMNNLPMTGKSTEKDVYKIFGKDVTNRWTYKTTQERKIGKTTFKFNKLIRYEDYIYQTTKTNAGNFAAVHQTPVEKTQIIIYLLDETVTFFSGRVQKIIDGKSYNTDKVVNLDEKGDYWPTSDEDQKAYHSQ